MKETVRLLELGFESSSGKTLEFMEFVKVFKKEFTSELKSVGCTNIKFSVGHFYVSGYFTTNDGQPYYFSTTDVREKSYCMINNPDSCMAKLLYRTVTDYNDYTGGVNRYAKFEFDMLSKMCYYFKIV